MNQHFPGENDPWKDLSIYQIYPCSFFDTNGDGIGDLNGITQKIGYLRDILGVNAVLLNPINPTSSKEGGYDVIDYLDIEPSIGTMGDFDRLVAELHSSGMKIIIDLVINHTSNEHPWFQDVEHHRDSPYGEYYIRRPSRPDNQPPNNWVGNFGGSAWRYIPARNEWALHSFLPEQVDLNFRNPKVLEEMGKVIRFWLEKGVDGVRLDSLPFTIKHPDLPDGKINENFNPSTDHPSSQVITDDKWFQPGMLEVQRYFADIVSCYPGKFILSESYPPPHLEEEWVGKIYTATRGKDHAPINSALVNAEWNPDRISHYLDWFYRQLRPGDRAIWSIDNHDVYHRVASRIGVEQARLAAMLLITLPGIPIIYYGDEIAMRSHEVPAHLQKDVFRRFHSDTWRTRDASRLPMSWNGSSNGGFTRSRSPEDPPWLPVAPDFRTVNVSKQLQDRRSSLNLFRQLIRTRQRYPELSKGSFQTVEIRYPKVLAYRLQDGNATSYVLLNFSAEPQPVTIHANLGRLLLTTCLDKKTGSLMDLNSIDLRANEGIIIKVN